MKKLRIINNTIIRSLKPCYDPAEIGIPEKENLQVKEWVSKYGSKVHNKSDIVYIIRNDLFLTNNDLYDYTQFCLSNIKAFYTGDYKLYERGFYRLVGMQTPSVMAKRVTDDYYAIAHDKKNIDDITDQLINKLITYIK